MMTTTTTILEHLKTLCDKVDATLRKLDDIRQGTIELSWEDEDDLVDEAYDLWDEIEGIVEGNSADLSDYERAIRVAAKSDEIRRADIAAGMTPQESGSFDWYLGQLSLIHHLFSISGIEYHVEMWNRAKDTIEKLRETLY